MNKIDIKNYKPLGEIVFDYLKNAIITGELAAGERLMETAIAEQLGVSRTPVREAIRKLEKEQFIEMIPRKGAYVSSTSVKDMLDVLEVRKFLEGFATELAAKRMTDEQMAELETIHHQFLRAMQENDVETMAVCDKKFHELIILATNNAKLMEMTLALAEQVERYRLSYFNDLEQYEEVNEWHQNIFKAIKEKDSKAASDAAIEHVKLIEKRVLNIKSKK